MRPIVAFSLLATTVVGSSAFAQYEHHQYCRVVGGGGTECAYDTMAQCQASKTGEDQSCMPNSAPTNH
jgi:hypothetical protein